MASTPFIYGYIWYILLLDEGKSITLADELTLVLYSLDKHALERSIDNLYAVVGLDSAENLALFVAVTWTWLD